VIRANSSHKLDGCGPIFLNKKSRTARKLEKFYASQNESIKMMLKPVDNHRAEAKQAEGDNHLKYKIAVYGFFAANVILAGLQMYSAVSSSSLSVITAMADAIFDPMSNVTLIVANRAVNRVDSRRYPSGKARIETAGNITFCFIMSAVGAVIIILSARDLASGSEGDTTGFHLPSVIAVAVAFVTKFALWLYCWALKDT
jgi:divalent metal cation (Fe/Co/Zn/Cd) transporter